MNPASGTPRIASINTSNTTLADPDTLRQCAVQCRFASVEASHPGSVGSTACALKMTGFGGPGNFVLVRLYEADAQSHADAVAMAGGADDMPAGAHVVDDIGEAFAGASLTIALTARPCEPGPRRTSPRNAAEEVAVLLAAPSTTITFVFGNERFDLLNEMVERCYVVTHVPANLAYASSDPPQAMQLIAREVRMVLLTSTSTGDTRIDSVDFVGRPTTTEQVDGMLEHLEQGLVGIDLLNPAQPKKLMPHLRRLFARTQLEVEEVNILRGVAKRMFGYRAEAAASSISAADDCC